MVCFLTRDRLVLNTHHFCGYLLNELMACFVLGIKIPFFRTETELIEEFGTSVPEAIFNDFGRNETFEVKRLADFSKPRTRDLGCTPIRNFNRSRGKPRSMWSLMIWGAVSKVTPEMASKYNIMSVPFLFIFDNAQMKESMPGGLQKHELMVKMAKYF